MKKNKIGCLLIFLNLAFLLYAQTSSSYMEFGKAFDLFKQGDFKGAGAAFAQLYQTSPQDALAANSCFMAAQAYFNAGDYPTSYGLCESFIQSYPEHSNIPDMEFLCGRILFKMGRLADAVSAFNTFLAAYPENELYPSVLFWKAESFYQLGDIAQALPLFDEINEKWPDSEKASLARWRLNVMGLEAREAKYSRLATFEAENNSTGRLLGQMQQEAYREQAYLRDYFRLKLLRQRNAVDISSADCGDENAKSSEAALADAATKNEELKKLLDAKERALDLLVSKIIAFLKEITP